MRNRLLLCVACCLLTGWLSTAEAAEPTSGKTAADFGFDSQDWPWWRGPQRNGTAAADQQPPVSWSSTENVLWSRPIPGRGHGSPIVIDDQVVLATADHESAEQSLVSLDRNTGEVQWATVIHSGNLPTKGNKKASLASSTPASDGQRIFINFLNGDGAYTTAVSREGKILWQTRITDYVIHQGYGSSPAIYGELVIVSADNKGGGAIAGLNRETGKVVWRVDRPSKPNYTSPIIFNVGGREQVLFTGCDMVSSFDPASGSKLWEVEGATTECVTSTVTDGRHVFTSGGYPDNHVSAVKADGSGELAWRNKVRVYVPSMLIRGEYLYAVADAGIAICFEAATGKEVWKHRLGGAFTSSPVLVGDLIYVTSEKGETTVFKASPAGYEEVGSGKLGDEVYSTPTICGGRIYVRVAHYKDEQRSETLYCLGSK